jgi:hypothetical protein
MHIGFFTVTKTDWWMSFVLWFAGVPSQGLVGLPDTLIPITAMSRTRICTIVTISAGR